MPREHQRGEHRNDHQMATAKRFCSTPGIHVCWNDQELRNALDGIDGLHGARSVSSKAPPDFTDRLRAFITDEEQPKGFWRRLLHPSTVERSLFSGLIPPPPHRLAFRN